MAFSWISEAQTSMETSWAQAGVAGALQERASGAGATRKSLTAKQWTMTSAIARVIFAVNAPGAMGEAE
eukprot:4733933-Pyramimonas_sp.AAC.1